MGVTVGSVSGCVFCIAPLTQTTQGSIKVPSWLNPNIGPQIK